MKILVLSDTHRHIRNVIHLLTDLTDVNRIVHLGDHVRDAQDIESIFSEIPVDYIAGNCDFFDSDTPKEKILTICDKRILITHGHLYNVKYGYEEIAQLVKKMKVDAVLFGHTHIPMVDYVGEGIVMNPGSISEPRDGRLPSYGILEIDEKGKFHVTLNQIK